jgi:uncharacterized protein involved in exopolysaccharide biosynthesis
MENIKTSMRNEPVTPMYSEEVSLAEYVLVLWGYRLPLLVTAILAGLLAFVVDWNRTPTYQASSKLLVSQSKIGEGVQTISIGTYQAIVNSQTLVAETMDELGLSKTPHGLSVPEVMARNLTVQVIPDTFIIQVTARLADPALAAGLANRMAERAVEASRRASQDDIVTARDTIKLQLDESRARLAETEKTIESYRREAHLDALQKEVDAMLEQRSRLLPLTVAIEAERARVKQTAEELANQKPVRDYQRSLAPAGGSDVPLRESLTDPYANPVYEVLAQRLAAGRTSLAGLEREYAEVSRATSLSAAGAKKLNELYVRKAESERLQSDLELARRVYVDAASRYEAARLQVASRSAQLQVIDRAVPPTQPVSPRVFRDTAAAIVLALVVTSGVLLLLAAVGRENLRRTS